MLELSIKGGERLEQNQIFIKEQILQQEMYYKNHMIMKYTIKYPKFISEKYLTLARKLNTLYRTKALMYERSNVMNLYQMAMVEYEYSLANNFPIRVFEAYIDYFVTYNESCALSLYFDQYEYAGGAHGLTIRSSDTWNLKKSKRMDLNEFFPEQEDYREYVIDTLNQMIEEEMSGNNPIYFENYSQLVRDNFKANNYYLTEEGVAIYFQQYDIAPYSSGIPTLVIPYSPNGPIEPRC